MAPSKQTGAFWRRLGLSLVLFLVFALGPGLTLAATTKDLERQIEAKNEEIKRLEAEINLFQGELKRVGERSSNLQAQIQNIDTTRRQLQSDLSSTDKKISTVNLAIKSLGLEIEDKKSSIITNRQAALLAFRLLNDYDRESLVETLLGKDNLAVVFQRSAQMMRLESILNQKTRSLEEVTADLAKKQKAVAENRQQLASLKAELSNQQQVTKSIQDKKAKELADNQKEENTYKLLVAQRLEKKRQVENEINQIEAALKITIDPNSLPAAGSKALAWPVLNPLITQYFGNTAFALANAAVYNGQGHNGIDLRAAVGAPILSAAAGEILGTGDTDQTCPGASYGKWALIRHQNNLTTLYAHLSKIGVEKGDRVAAGEEIGQAGETGYATGPHLHFAVFASAGVQIGSLQSKVPGCGVYRLPIGSYNSYLNPVLYL